ASRTAAALSGPGSAVDTNNRPETEPTGKTARPVRAHKPPPTPPPPAPPPPPPPPPQLAAPPPPTITTSYLDRVGCICTG
ncbi:hypothetical protein, partial [Nocardia brasiliensis]|uniref:hypothetical protein n=1 Tax=Nocardia brasiliensis TaxID=37326 RepID=UPI00245458F2